MKNDVRKWARRSGLGLVAATTLITGCATGQDATQNANEVRVAALQTRLEETERTNGRLTVRIEELEDQVFLLQDRVEANRLSLQRRGYMRGAVDQGIAQAAPQPAPQSFYGGQNYGYQQQQPSSRNIRRIPLGQANQYGQQQDMYQQPLQQQEPQQRQAQRQNYQEAVPTQTINRGEEPELVITEKEYREFAGEAPRESASSSRKRTAQPAVTDEKLATTRELENKSVQDLERPQTAEKKAERKDALSLYKDALALYRSGNYAKALQGFQSFLDSKPRADYVDNALYWLGECQFGLGSYEKSVAYFRRVLKEQPDGNKVPDAMLKMSMAYERMGRPDDARSVLESLASQYPTTSAGKLGQQKLNGGS